MKICHLVKIHFDRRTAAITDEWFNRRYEFFEEWTLESLKAQSFKDWTLWVSFGCNIKGWDPIVAVLLRKLEKLGIGYVATYNDQHAPFTVDDRSILQVMADVVSDYVYVTRLDSDDIYSPDALQIANDCRPLEPNRTEASMFRRGYMCDVRTGELGVYHSPSTPFHTMMIPRSVFVDPVKYAALDYGDHSKVNSCYPTQVLPDWKFTVLIHGSNFLSTMSYGKEQDTPVEQGWNVDRFFDNPVVFDVDDLCDQYDCLPELDRLKEKYPDFKCTLFTIPDKTSKDLLKQCQQRPWIELAWHGVKHEPNEELKSIDGPHLFRALHVYKSSEAGSFYADGFRPPGWYIQPHHIEALNNLGMWVAIHKRDEKRLGPLCRHGYYICNDDRNYWHGHSHSTCGNGIQDRLEELLKKWPVDQKFGFVSDAVLVSQSKYNSTIKEQDA